MEGAEEKPLQLDQQLAPRLAALLQPEQGSGADEEVEPALALALLADAVDARASDLHVEPRAEGVSVRLRIDGLLRQAARLPIFGARRLISQLRTLARLDPVLAFEPEDARVSVRVEGREIDLRMASAPCLGGEKLAIRLFDPAVAPHRLEDLGLAGEDADALRSWLHSRTGMFLAAGPTGAGKTTTAHALLRSREDETRSAITIEDPVEYRIEDAAQIEIDPEHALSWPEALGTVLRMDPDYLLVGEIRDETSARTAVRAAVSGHAVLTTLHARSAAAAVTPLLARGVERHELAASLSVVVAQRLVRRLCDRCRRRGEPDAASVRWLEAAQGSPPATHWRAVGCDACHAGYRGRIGLFEVWAVEDEERDLLVGGGDEHRLRQRLRERGVASLLDDGLVKAERGLTTLEELRRVPDLLRTAE